jgi:hypothetical protein
MRSMALRADGKSCTAACLAVESAEHTCGPANLG